MYTQGKYQGDEVNLVNSIDIMTQNKRPFAKDYFMAYVGTTTCGKVTELEQSKGTGDLF